jgi:hypothetical protein
VTTIEHFIPPHALPSGISRENPPVFEDIQRIAQAAADRSTVPPMPPTQRPPEIEPADLELLRALVPILAGVRGFALSLARKLAPAPAEPQDESPEEALEQDLEQGLELLGADLRCIVIDTIDPAIQRLEALIEECAPRPSP